MSIVFIRTTHGISIDVLTGSVVEIVKLKYLGTDQLHDIQINYVSEIKKKFATSLTLCA